MTSCAGSSCSFSVSCGALAPQRPWGRHIVDTKNKIPLRVLVFTLLSSILRCSCHPLDSGTSPPRQLARGRILRGCGRENCCGSSRAGSGFRVCSTLRFEGGYFSHGDVPPNQTVSGEEFHLANCEQAKRIAWRPHARAFAYFILDAPDHTPNFTQSALNGSFWRLGADVTTRITFRVAEVMGITVHVPEFAL